MKTVFQNMVFANLFLLVFAFVAQAQQGKPEASKDLSAQRGRSEEGLVQMANVHILQPLDGAEIERTTTFKFSVDRLKVAKAGEVVPGAGHFHLLIDAAPVKEGEVVPDDVKHIHYSRGETEGKVTLTPGTHTITLQFADGLHRTYNKMLTHTITVRVK